MAKHNPPVGIAIITHNAKHHLKACLPLLLKNSKVLVVNSSSKDGTVEEAQKMGAETLVIPRSEFNHGLTRELARKVLGTDIVVMMTPDAYVTSHSTIDTLIAPIIKQEASVCYARQLPHDGAGFFETFPRLFNYPPESHVRGILDVDRYGIYTIFCSDACAAYLNAALDEIGGFQEVLTGEDTLAVANLLQRGHRIAYVAEACVKHSHHYSLLQEFRRHFDTGLARTICKDQIAFAGNDVTRGTTYMRQMFKSIFSTRPYLLPYGVLHLFAKWFGYQLGAMSVKAPRWFKRACSSQDFYWK